MTKPLIVKPKSGDGSTPPAIPKVEPLKEGEYETATLDIEPCGVHTKADYQHIADVLKSGKAYVLEARTTRNITYNLRKRLKNEYGIKILKFGALKSTGQTVLYTA